jgi:hypothetical protein
LSTPYFGITLLPVGLLSETAMVALGQLQVVTTGASPVQNYNVWQALSLFNCQSPPLGLACSVLSVLKQHELLLIAAAISAHSAILVLCLLPAAKAQRLRSLHP